MYATPNGSSRSGTGNVFRRVTSFPGRIAARREHDAAMTDTRIAAEHAFQVAHATSHGKAGCEFCG
jgi:hypothetical protein